MNYIIEHIDRNKSSFIHPKLGYRVYKRPGTHLVPKSITIHSTDNPRSTPQNERDWLMNPSNKRWASWHICVGDSYAIEAIPLNERALHAGHSRGNTESIGIEMVETGNRQKVICNTVKLTAKLLKQFNLTTNDVVRHYDWSKKNCPSILNYSGWKGWVEFKTLLRLEIEGDKNMSEEKIRKIVGEEIQKALYPSSVTSGLGAWSKPNFINLNARGIKVNEERFNDVVTRGELFALLARITEPKTLLNVIDHAENSINK